MMSKETVIGKLVGNKMSNNLILELTEQEAKHLMNCLMRTHANGKDLDVGEMIEEKIFTYLKENSDEYKSKQR
jgi:hypothetical protein